MNKEENEKKNLTTEEMEKVNGGSKKSQALSGTKSTNPIIRFFKKLFGMDHSDD